MTKEQLNRGKEIQEEISDLKESVDEIKGAGNSGLSNDYQVWINKFYCRNDEYQAFIQSLIKTRKDKIKELEKEFKEL